MDVTRVQADAGAPCRLAAHMTQNCVSRQDLQLSLALAARTGTAELRTRRCRGTGMRGTHGMWQPAYGKDASQPLVAPYKYLRPPPTALSCLRALQTASVAARCRSRRDSATGTVLDNGTSPGGVLRHRNACRAYITVAQWYCIAEQHAPTVGFRSTTARHECVAILGGHACQLSSRLCDEACTAVTAATPAALQPPGLAATWRRSSQHDCQAEFLSLVAEIHKSFWRVNLAGTSFFQERKTYILMVLQKKRLTTSE